MRKKNVTSDLLIQDYQSLKKKLNRQPFAFEYYSKRHSQWIVDRTFGNLDKSGWRALVTAVGDKIQGPLAADHLIEDFLNLQARLGRRPKVEEYRKECHAVKVLDRVFGKPGWGNMIQLLGKKAEPVGLTEEHLIQDYLDTRTVLEFEPNFYYFHKRHRHKMKSIERVFGKPGWEKFQKAVDEALRSGLVVPPVKRIKKRAKVAVLKDIQETYCALLPGRLTGNAPAPRHLAKMPPWKLRNRLQDLFHEAGRAFSLEEAFS
jgi:hypothetical protein